MEDPQDVLYITSEIEKVTFFVFDTLLVFQQMKGGVTVTFYF